jgi:HTH-type transcriptional regulator / antitoxin HigA
MQKIVSKFQIKPILDDKNYDSACEIVEKLMEMGEQPDAESENIRAAYLNAWAILIEEYERKSANFFKIKLTLIDLLEFALEQKNMTKRDLSKLLGASRVSEIFKGTRQLSLGQIQILHRQLHIPLELLVFSGKNASELV